MKSPFKNTLTASLLLLALNASPCGAALNAYLRITGETQGEIQGGVTQAGREGSIECISFEHTVVSPRDAASGLPTGKRQHTPIKLTMPIDKATPLIANAWSNNENLTEVTLRFYRPDATGTEQQYYTISLQNARVSSIRTWKPNTRDPESIALPDMVEVQLVYQRIIWTWEDGGITAEDDWETPVN